MSLVARIIAEDAIAMEQLRAVRELDLPDWCIAAGFVRNRVWDHLHGIVPARLPVDIDVIYFDAGDVSRESEAAFERRLDGLLPGQPWQVRNQARMHLRNGDAPYTCATDALRYWPETATAVAVRLTREDRIEIAAPLGLQDLWQGLLRPAGAFATDKQAQFAARVHGRGWLARWPQLRVVAAQDAIE